MINTMVSEHEGYISLLCTIPGVDRNSAITIISEIGTDMAQFSSSRRLCCWAGLTSGREWLKHPRYAKIKIWKKK
jgi:transposase